MTEKRSLTGRLWDQVPELRMPKLGKSVDIPVYVVHTGLDVENYYFIFDFEQFVERSGEGMFVRPRLQIWAGRSDFNRRKFGRLFRESFSEEFEAARAALHQKNRKSWGWLNWDLGVDMDPFSAIAASIIVNTVLLVAVAGPKAMLSLLPIPRFLRGKSKEEKLEASIAETQAKVDTALADMEIHLHQELYTHAYRGQTPGSRVGMAKEAWPLPKYVREHLTEKKSTSWW